jgi:hypothetical protein
MRYVSLLLMVVLLLLSTLAAQACGRSIIRDFDGDPDEFQATNVHDETGSKLVLYWYVNFDPTRGGEPSKSETPVRVRKRRRFSISFSGRKSFLGR